MASPKRPLRLIVPMIVRLRRDGRWLAILPTVACERRGALCRAIGYSGQPYELPYGIAMLATTPAGPDDIRAARRVVKSHGYAPTIIRVASDRHHRRRAECAARYFANEALRESAHA